MWKNNRPDDWKNPYALKQGQMGITDPFSVRVMEKNAYEAGADAMLEALKKEGKDWHTMIEKYGFNTTLPKGTVVLIPESE